MTGNDSPRLRSVMPCFLVPDVGRSVAWYRELLGFKNGGGRGKKGDVGDIHRFS